MSHCCESAHIYVPEEITKQAKTKFHVFGYNYLGPGVKAQLAVLHCGYKTEKGLNSLVLEIPNVYVPKRCFLEVEASKL